MSQDMRKQIGNLGERLALEAYLHLGYTLIVQQYRTSLGEIDLIVSKENTYVFVEVRTKTSSQYGEPEESITRTKQHRIKRVSQCFLQENHLYSLIQLNRIQLQYDVVTITINKNTKKAYLNRLAHAF